jgi:dipeptidyl aminopeptidase/acylaminoacyl peptidase
MLWPQQANRSSRLASLLIAMVLSSGVVSALGASPQNIDAANEPVTPGAFSRISTLVDTQIAPDGKRILYVLSSVDASKGSRRTEIWWIGRQGGNPTRAIAGEANNSQPKWAPGGERFAFVSDRSGRPQLWIQRLGQAPLPEPVPTGDSPIESYQWSGDGQQIAFLSLKSDRADRGDAAARVALSIVDIDTGRVRELTTESSTVTDFSWAPSGSEIAIAHQPSVRPIDDFNSDIDVIDIKTGVVRPLVHRPGKDAQPRWSPDGRLIAFISRNGERGEFGAEDVFVVPAQGGDAQDITPTVGERNYGFYGWSADSREVLFRVRQGVTMQLLATDIATKQTQQVTTGLEVYDSFSFSGGKTQWMSFAATDAVHPKDLYVSRLRQFKPIRVAVSNDRFNSLQLGATSVLHWKAEDGMALEGLVTTPYGYRKDLHYPLVVAVHGGPSGAFTIGLAPQIAAIAAPAELEPYPPQLYAACGFVIFMPNVRGSGGYGDAFRSAVIGDWGGADYHDVLKGIDALSANGIADSQRVGIAGWSYGGYMAAWAITQSHRFKAASVGAGVSDLISWYGLTDQPDNAEAYFRGTPWQRPELYSERSAVFFAQNVTTPTLIQHGENDEAVPFSQALELQRALERQGVEVRFEKISGAGHVVSNPLQISLIHEQNLSWFTTHLGVDKNSVPSFCFGTSGIRLAPKIPQEGMQRDHKF